MAQLIELTANVPLALSEQRLDQLLATLFPDYSRTRLKSWIMQGRVAVNGCTVDSPRESLFGGEKITVQAVVEPTHAWQAESIALNIVYQDEHLLVLNKPRRQVVHPGAGNSHGTLLNGLLHHFPEMAVVPRAGIVHRLDKDTSGLMVVAKSLAAHTRLVTSLQERAVVREYQAVVIGAMTGGGCIDLPIGRHPQRRTQMAVHPMGKPATTHYRVLERFRAHTHIQLRLESGRTHQIRVHMASLGHPLVGDPMYGGMARPPKGACTDLLQLLRQFAWQALHATRLQLQHPISGELLQWQLPLPEDMLILTKTLREDTKIFDETHQW